MKKKKLAFAVDSKKKTTPAGTKKKVLLRKHKPPKPEFEKALSEVVEVQEESQPGPGRQDPGASDNLDSLDRELSKAPQALAPVLKIPFAIWANVSEIPEMKLSDAEAEEWSEPIIGLLEYYFPGKIPEIAWMWLMFLSATEKVIDSRVKIRHEKRKERNQSASAPMGPAVTSNTTSQPAPIHNGAEPAQGYPSEPS